MRCLHDAAPMKIASGEWLATHWEFEDLIERGKIDVAQPDVGRVGGFIEAKKVCDLAAARGRIIVPHCWKTGLSVTATAHLGVQHAELRLHRISAAASVRRDVAARTRAGGL